MEFGESGGVLALVYLLFCWVMLWYIWVLWLAKLVCSMHGICVEECGLLFRFTDGFAYGSIRVLMRYFFLINSTGFST
jgi:hypothetical protein